MINQRLSTLILLTAMTMIVATVVVASGLLFGTRTINNAGNINSIGVGVYWENTCVNEIETIDWEYLEPGSVENVTIYIRNEGNIPMTLNVSTSSWNPAQTSVYVTLSWNREDSVVSSQSVLEAILTMQVSLNVTEITSFDFDITITGTE